MHELFKLSVFVPLTKAVSKHRQRKYCWVSLKQCERRMRKATRFVQSLSLSMWFYTKSVLQIFYQNSIWINLGYDWRNKLTFTTLTFCNFLPEPKVALSKDLVYVSFFCKKFVLKLHNIYHSNLNIWLELILKTLLYIDILKITNKNILRSIS